jgi:beta-carotene 3-hydroxylase
MGQLVLIFVFILTFMTMEFLAWLLHKYVMHGFLWCLHQDHHVRNKNRRWEKNDFFALVFAVPSFLFILFDKINGMPLLGIIGYGIMAYGGVYFLVHEVIIHRRLILFSRVNHWYIQALNSAHKVHHSVYEKNNTGNFGMLVVPIFYFKNSLKNKTTNPPLLKD